MPRPALLGHRKKTGSGHDKAPERRGVPGIRGDPGCRWRAVRREIRGHRQRFSESAAELCLTLGMPFEPPLRQGAGLGKSHTPQRMAGFDLWGPDCSPPCRRQARSVVDIPHAGVGKRPHIVGDSPGMRRRRDSEWPVRKPGPRVAVNGARSISLRRVALAPSL
ncbi:transposase [Rhodovulum sulfidophilum]|uniref:Transposase n=1 Tax=Rhodovulum sulfidophilum TaxID=35806 RepID=A0ABS1RVA9_RHOSU|nr:transposase [Rhodovulum sulfidophilum]